MEQVHTTLRIGDDEHPVFAERDGEWWIGWIEDVHGVNAQERTLDELLVSLRMAFEDMYEFSHTAP